MNPVKAIFQSTPGKKYLMATSGLLLLLFVIGHMLGNLQIFLGKETLNAYGAFLKSEPLLLWGARVGLLVLLAVHLWAAITLTMANRRARPLGYRVGHPSGAGYASRTMALSGIIILAFVIYHLMHFTLGTVDADLLRFRDDAGRHDIHRMVIEGFSRPLVSGFYILSMGLLCFHLSHGAASLLQSLGLCSGRGRAWSVRLAHFLAWGIFLGNSSIPIAILLGYGGEALAP